MNLLQIGDGNMFKRRDISMEDSLKRACEDNGFIYTNEECDQIKTITLVNERGVETVVNKNFEVVEAKNIVKTS